MPCHCVITTNKAHLVRYSYCFLLFSLNHVLPDKQNLLLSTLNYSMSVKTDLYLSPTTCKYNMIFRKGNSSGFRAMILFLFSWVCGVILIKCFYNNPYNIYSYYFWGFGRYILSQISNIYIRTVKLYTSNKFQYDF